MPLTKIDHYAIRTNKLEETKAFYELLGLVDGERPNFPFAGYWLYLGDIAISFEIIDRRSKSSSFDHELDKMWIHGYLHLLGHDHKKNKDYYLMNKRENLIFKKLNKIN